MHDYFEIRKVLVVAPLRVADDTWTREADKWDHLRHLRISKVLGNAAARRKALKAEADIYVTNRENVDWVLAEVGVTQWDFDTVVIDEASSFKNYRSKRFRALRRVRPLLKRVIALTGTPAPNSLIDLWAPLFLLDQGQRLGKTVTGYRERYFTPNQRNGNVVFNWKEKKESEAQIYKVISDIAVSMKAEDWLQLPEKIERTVPIKFNQALYKKMENELLLPYRDADVVANTAATLSNKLLQMASGAVYDEERGIKHIHEAKLDALEDIIEAANGKPVMVFYNYGHSLSRIQERFPKAKKLSKKEDIYAWNHDEIPILLLHPKSAGHGLNLQESSCQTVVWFDQVWSLEENQQANARIHRQGQTRRIVILRLVAEGTIDDDVIAALERKATGQEELMQAVKARIERIGV